jgi:hypothetical protein
MFTPTLVLTIGLVPMVILMLSIAVRPLPSARQRTDRNW